MNRELDSFIEYLLDIKKYSIHTSNNYKLDIEEYISYCKNINIDPFNIDYQDIKKYLMHLYEKKYKPTTVSRKISALRSFYKFLLNNSKVNENPFIFISLPKKEKKLPKYVNYEDVSTIFNTPDLNSFYGIRDRLILELLYGTGIRVSELCNIKLKDITISSNKILILGKGNKERIVYYGDYCDEILNKYLELRNSYLKGKNHDYLLLNRFGNKINKRTVQNTLSEILKKASIKKNITPHTLRHTFATHLLNEGCDILTVKELLGHSSLDTTQIYTHVSNEKLRSEYLKTHPRA